MQQPPPLHTPLPPPAAAAAVVGSPDDKVTVYHHFNRQVLTRESYDNLLALDAAGPHPERALVTPSLPEGEGCEEQCGIGTGGEEDGVVEIDYAVIKYPMATKAGASYDDLPTYPPRPHFQKKHLHMQLSTQLVVYDGCPKDPYHPASMPIYQTSTFVQPSATEFGPYDYTRSGNPTRTALETLIAGLENAHSAFAFSSGMAALSTITRLVQAGEEVIAGDDLYGGMYRLLTKVSARCGVITKFVDTTNLEAVKGALTSKTRLVHVESPSNPLMRITDLRALATMLRERNIILSVDCTMMSPICQRGLDLGVDIVVHSGTKFLSGHSDTMMGVVCVRSEPLAKEIAFYQNAEGSGLAPFDCWLVLRGMKTLSLRVERQTANAYKVAQYLSTHKLVKQLNYPGLPPNNPDPALQEQLQKEFELHHRQATGGGSVLSFTTGSQAISKKYVACLSLETQVSRMQVCGQFAFI
eukprot:TRINITY_DN4341_c0_g1_i2.p1 TRINITY_DN4341_c0_g1~~TRINITY_DN4341_c0_g1_i2.p1  ORF type:complete len:469 (-),score=44.43 TRINITY_DN4341_c0_g1_i2:344-1750(-)